MDNTKVTNFLKKFDKIKRLRNIYVDKNSDAENGVKEEPKAEVEEESMPAEEPATESEEKSESVDEPEAEEKPESEDKEESKEAPEEKQKSESEEKTEEEQKPESEEKTEEEQEPESEENSEEEQEPESEEKTEEEQESVSEEETEEEAEPEQSEPETKEEVIPEKTGEEIKAEKLAEKKRKRDKKLRYNVLMIPNNNHRIKQFKISFDFILTILAIFAVIVFGIVMYVVSTVNKIDELEDKIAYRDARLSEWEDQEVLYQAQIEALESSLREAKVTIDANKTIQQQETEKQQEQTKPTSFPVDNASTLPTEYSEDKPYVEFTTGFGTKVLATADGVVSSVEQDEEHGNVVKVDHGNGYMTVYMIKSVPAVSEKDKVIRGTTLFVVDDDNQTLAYQIMFNEVPIDPMTILDVNG